MLVIMQEEDKEKSGTDTPEEEKAKSGTDTPEETTVDPAERGGAAWMAVCEAQLSDPDGLAKFRTFVRRFVRKGGDIDKLCEELTFGVQDDPDCLKRFFDGEEDFTTISSLLSSAE